VTRSSGFFSMRSTCPACGGQGAVIRDPCRDCRGEGYVPQKVTLKVDVPPGVDSNTRLRVTGEGHPDPRGGRPGDCYCFITVRPHPLFEREGRHLICQVPISYSQAALGAEIDIPTLDGAEQLDVPAGTQNGEVFKLKGKGMPDPRHSGRGDLLVQVHVEVPKKLSSDHEDLLRRLAEVEQAQVTPQRKSFFQKLRDCFQLL
jgi:molecular chaperone DnaJ